MNERLLLRIKYSKQFEKQLEKAPVNIKRSFRKRLGLLLQNPHSLQLRNHALSGKFSGYRSINITGDWRALYTEASTSTQTVIKFQLLGTHSQLYR